MHTEELSDHCTPDALAGCIRTENNLKTRSTRYLHVWWPFLNLKLGAQHCQNMAACNAVTQTLAACTIKCKEDNIYWHGGAASGAVKENAPTDRHKNIQCEDKQDRLII